MKDDFNISVDSFKFDMDSVKEHIQKVPKDATKKEGQVSTGTVVSIRGNSVIIDVGLKSEGVVQKSDIGYDINIGDTILVYVENHETSTGSISISVEKARKEESMKQFEECMREGTNIPGKIVRGIRDRRGISEYISRHIVLLNGNVEAELETLELDEIIARLPYSQILSLDLEFVILSIDPSGRIKVSQKDAAKNQVMSEYKVGDIVEVEIKNVKHPYGAFVSLPSKKKEFLISHKDSLISYIRTDCMLHVADVTHEDIKHPTEDPRIVLGNKITVKILSMNFKAKRISVGLKQMDGDAWEILEKSFKVGDIIEDGVVYRTRSYGVFVDIKVPPSESTEYKGRLSVQGLVHLVEVGWVNSPIDLSERFKKGDLVKVMIISIDSIDKKIGLSIKACQENPFDRFLSERKIGDIVSAEVCHHIMYENGKLKNWMIVRIDDYGITASIYKGDISWEMHSDKAIAQYSKGDKIKARITDMRRDDSPTLDERKSYQLTVKLSIKDLIDDPYAHLFESILKVDNVVKCYAVPYNENYRSNEEFKKHSDETRITKLIIPEVPESFYCFTKAEHGGGNVFAKVIKVDVGTRKVELAIQEKTQRSPERRSSAFSSEKKGSTFGDIKIKSKSVRVK